MANFSVVLMNPKGDSNIGSCARAMKNFGVTDMHLVNPTKHLTKNSYMMAVDAKDVLENSTVHRSLDDAVSNSSFVAAFTRRLGKLRRMHTTIEEAVPVLQKRASMGNVSLVFGTEDKGLSNDDIKRADMVVYIPTSEKLPSLNLAQAVAITCYELFETKIAINETFCQKFASRGEILPLLDKLEMTLDILGYEDTPKDELKTKIVNHFKGLFGRAGLTGKDIRMFEGLFASIHKLSKIKA